MSARTTRETLTSTRRLTVYRDRVTTAAGAVRVHDHVALRESVTVLAMRGDGAVAVTRQRIYTHGDQPQWRLPTGGVDDGDADQEAAARRELREETGLTGGSWSALGVVHGADAATNHRESAFLATGLTQGEPCRGVGEDDLEVHWLRFPAVLDLVLTGLMPHAGSAFAVLTAAVVARADRFPFPTE